MFKNNRRFQLLIVVFSLQCTILLAISLSYEIVSLTGSTYQFKVVSSQFTGPLRERYLSDFISTDAIRDHLGDYKGPCYITIEKDKNGYAYLAEACIEKPQYSDYITAQKYDVNGYDTYFTKYFINKTALQHTKQLLSKNAGESTVVVKVKNGRSVVEGLCIGDRLVNNFFE